VKKPPDDQRDSIPGEGMLSRAAPHTLQKALQLLGGPGEGLLPLWLKQLPQSR